MLTDDDRARVERIGGRPWLTSGLEVEFLIDLVERQEARIVELERLWAGGLIYPDRSSEDQPMRDSGADELPNDGDLAQPTVELTTSGVAALEAARAHEELVDAIRDICHDPEHGEQSVYSALAELVYEESEAAVAAAVAEERARVRELVEALRGADLDHSWTCGGIHGGRPCTCGMGSLNDAAAPFLTEEAAREPVDESRSATGAALKAARAAVLKFDLRPAFAALVSDLEREAGAAAVAEERERANDVIADWETEAAMQEAARLDERAEAAGRVRALVEAARAVVDLWDVLLPHIQGAESLARVHGWKYIGPEGGMPVAMDPLRVLLAAPFLAEEPQGAV